MGRKWSKHISGIAVHKQMEGSVLSVGKDLCHSPTEINETKEPFNHHAFSFSNKH